MPLASGYVFNPEELARYSRHLLLPEVGQAGQERLRSASVLIIGVGGLGSPAALYLAAAGVGTIGIVDNDTVDLTNLQRQVLHTTRDVARRKTDSAAERITLANPNVRVVTHPVHLTAENALAVLEPYDVIVDGTDNFATRYLVNDACILLGKPNVYGSVLRFEGQATVLGMPDGPCYRCLYPTPPAPGTVANCEEAGVLGVLPGLVGVIQATETLKLILGIGQGLVGRLLLVDAMRMRFHSMAIVRDPTCPACGTHELTELADYDALCAARPVDARSQAVRSMSPRELSARLAVAGAPLVLDVREEWEWGIARISGARLIPLGVLDAAMHTLSPHEETVVYCHLGLRSRAAAEHLLESGFSSVWNLEGGIAAWRAEVEPEMAGY